MNGAVAPHLFPFSRGGFDWCTRMNPLATSLTLLDHWALGTISLSRRRASFVSPRGPTVEREVKALDVAGRGREISVLGAPCERGSCLRTRGAFGGQRGFGTREMFCNGFYWLSHIDVAKTPGISLSPSLLSFFTS
jgi:hypothetical protein